MATPRDPFNKIPSKVFQAAANAGLQVGRQINREKFSIECPNCGKFKRNGSTTVVFADTLGVNCFSCGYTGRLTAPRGESAEIPTFRSPASKATPRNRVVNMGEARAIFAGSQDDDRPQALRDWVACERKWPLELAAKLPPDIHVIPRAKAALRAGRASRAILEMYAAKHYRLVCWLRDINGHVVNGKFRWRKKGAPSRYKKSRQFSNTYAPRVDKLRVFGSLPVALKARRIIVVEGEADWAAVHAITDDETAVIGASNDEAMTNTLRAIAGLLEGSEGPEIVVCPDNKAKAIKHAREGIAYLKRRGAQVKLASLPYDREDIADVLKHDGIAQALAVLDGAAPVESRARDLGEARAELGARIAETVTHGGKLAIKAFTGAGKTTAVLKALATLRGRGERALYLVPTRKIAEDLETAAYHVGLTPDLRLGINEETCKLESKSLKGGIINSASLALPSGFSRLCAKCPFSHECEAFKLRHRPMRAEVVIATHAAINAYPVNNDDGITWQRPQWVSKFNPSHVVWDEDPTAYLRTEATVTPEMAETVSPKLAKYLRSVDEADSGELAKSLPSDKLGEIAEWSREIGHQEIDGLADGNEAKETSIQIWWLGHAIREAAAREWQGCYVHGGEMRILANVAEMLQGRRSTLYLDATTSKARAAGLLPGSGYLDLSSAPPESATILYTTRDVSKSCLKSNEGGAIDRLLREQHDGPNTLHLTHKRYREELGERVQGPIIHHNDSEAKGSNAFEHCSAIVANNYNVPRRAILAYSEELAMRERMSGVDLDVDWSREARQALETAPLIQAVGRIRHYSGEPVTVVLMRKGEIPELPATDVISTYGLLLEHDISPRGPESIPAQVNALLRDGIIFTSRNADKHGARQGLGAKRLYIPEAKRPEPLAQLVMAVARHHKSDWGHVAQLSGARYDIVTTNEGWVGVLSDPSLSVQDIAAQVRQRLPHLDWIEVRGERQTYDNKLSRAMAGYAGELTLEAIVAHTGTSKRTIQRWVSAAGYAGVSQFLALERRARGDVECLQTFGCSHAQKPVSVSDVPLDNSTSADVEGAETFVPTRAEKSLTINNGRPRSAPRRVRGRQWAINAARAHAPSPPQVFIDVEAYVTGVLSCHAKVPVNRLRSGNITEKEWARLMRAATDLSRSQVVNTTIANLYAAKAQAVELRADWERRQRARAPEEITPDRDISAPKPELLGTPAGDQTLMANLPEALNEREPEHYTVTVGQALWDDWLGVYDDGELDLREELSSVCRQLSRCEPSDRPHYLADALCIARLSAWKPQCKGASWHSARSRLADLGYSIELVLSDGAAPSLGNYL